MRIPERCPLCGSPAWRRIRTYRSGYSFGKSILGAMLFGWRAGIWLGMWRRRKWVYACPECRFVMEYEI